MPKTANQRTSVRVCSISRGVSFSSVASDWPIRPISVPGPVAAILTSPVPRTASVPE